MKTPTVAEPIDILIARTLADGAVYTTAEIAETWGEDRQRVLGWLIKFKAKGLVHLFARERSCDFRWAGDPARLTLYILGRKDAIA